MAMMISWVAPVNPSHPYLENDPAPSFDRNICAFHLGFSLDHGISPDLVSPGSGYEWLITEDMVSIQEGVLHAGDGFFRLMSGDLTAAAELGQGLAESQIILAEGLGGFAAGVGDVSIGVGGTILGAFGLW